MKEAKPIEFNEFYRQLKLFRKSRIKEGSGFDDLLVNYREGINSQSVLEDLGMRYCVFSIEVTRKYTGIEELDYILKLDKAVWDYLEYKIKESINEYAVKKIIAIHEKEGLTTLMMEKWNCKDEEITDNLEGLARYVFEGVDEIIENN